MLLKPLEESALLTLFHLIAIALEDRNPDILPMLAALEPHHKRELWDCLAEGDRDKLAKLKGQNHAR